MNTPHIDPDRLFARAEPEEQTPFGRQLIDVRQPEEFELGHAVGAVSIPLAELSLARLESEGTCQHKPLYIICRSGYRSLVACQLLDLEGWTNGINVAGGTLAWLEAGLPLHFPLRP